MKTFFLDIFIITILASCNKKDNHEPETRICPAINRNAVPVVVIAAFQNKYPSDSVDTWFRKDSIGYCAYFIQNDSVEKLAEFSNTGSFIQENIDYDNDGDFEDSASLSTHKITGCACEIPE